MTKPQFMPASLTQQAFSFHVDDEEVLPESEEQQRRRLAYVLDYTNLKPLHLEILKRPIFTPKGEKLLREIEQQKIAQVEIEFVVKDEPTLNDKAVDIEALIVNPFKFVACFFETVLGCLADVGGVDEKIDTLEWMFLEDRSLYAWPPPTKDMISGVKQTSFPFTWCCKILGYDADELRTGVKAALLNLLRETEARIRAGEYKSFRRDAIAQAVDCVNQRSTNAC